MFYNQNHNGQKSTPSYGPAHSYMLQTTSIRPTQHHGFANRTALQSEQLTDCNFPYNYQYQEVLNPNLAFNHQITVLINWLEPVISEATLLASVMVEQPIIQAAISSVETFDDIKSSFDHMSGKCSTNFQKRTSYI